MVIDTHQHFWHYTTDEFGWIPDDMAGIRRDFLPADLAPLLAANHVDGVIAVQARQTEAETRWLLQLADQHAFIHGVIGWLDLRSAGIGSQLEEFFGGAFVGVRHVLQGEPDAFMEGADFNRGLAAVAQANLTYDLLVFERQLPAAIALVDRHPRLRFVLDHFGKPRIDIDELEPWRTNLPRTGQTAQCLVQDLRRNHRSRTRLDARPARPLSRCLPGSLRRQSLDLRLQLARVRNGRGLPCVDRRGARMVGHPFRPRSERIVREERDGVLFADVGHGFRKREKATRLIWWSDIADSGAFNSLDSSKIPDSSPLS